MPLTKKKMQEINFSHENLICQFLFDRGHSKEECESLFSIWERHREGRLYDKDRKVKGIKQIVSDINNFIKNSPAYWQVASLNEKKAIVQWEPRFPQGINTDQKYWDMVRFRKRYDMGPCNPEDPIEVMDYDNARLDDEGDNTTENDDDDEDEEDNDEAAKPFFEMNAKATSSEEQKGATIFPDPEDDCPCTKHINIARFDAVQLVDNHAKVIEMRIPEVELDNNILNTMTPFLFKLAPEEGEKDKNTYICVVRRLSNIMTSKKNPSTPIQDHLPASNPPPLAKRAPSSNHWDADHKPSEAATASEWEALTACSRTLF